MNTSIRAAPLLVKHISRFLGTNHQCSLHTSKLLFSYSNPPRSRDAVMIRLYDQEGKSIGTKSKSDAESMAKKSNLVLVAMPIAGKPKYPEYQLKSRHDFADDFPSEEKNETTRGPGANYGYDDGKTGATKETKKDSQAKKPSEGQRKSEDIKRLSFDSSISEYDMDVKLNQINRWIVKSREIQVTVFGKNGKSLDDVFDQIKSKLVPEARHLQKRIKGNMLRFTLDRDPGKDKASDLPQSPKEATSQGQFAIDPKLLLDDVKMEELLNSKKVKK